MNRFENSPLYQIMHPHSVAFWGASSNPTGMGTVQLTQLLAMGFPGQVYPMHPRETEILGLKAYAHPADLPGPVDLAIFVLPTKVVPEVMEECGKAGIKRIIIVSAGFGEVGPDGQEMQNRLVEIARQYGITFLGPNCIGVVNTYSRLNTTFFPYDGSRGFVGLASQSGSFITQTFVSLEKLGLGFSQAVSVGNEAMIDQVACLEYLGDCPQTRVIGMYVEGIRRGREFFRVAREVSRKKPIVAYYVGGSESGRRAALSHTGVLAGPDRLYEGIFRQCGIIRARTMEELFDFCAVLGSQPLPRSDRVAVLTHSGGPGAAAADTAERTGMHLAVFSPQTVEALKQIVPHTASVANPVDLTFNRNPNDYTETIPGVLLADDSVDSMFLYTLLPWRRVMQTIMAMGKTADEAKIMADSFVAAQADAVVRTWTERGKPMVGGSFCTRDETFIRELQDRGFPVLPSPERAVRALAALTQYARYRGDAEH
ncbi:MAG: CoA-binding protein [Desulfomonile tiedjei]|nr:CoA-binding protein [Desulfomonile tiedjei]